MRLRQRWPMIPFSLLAAACVHAKPSSTSRASGPEPVATATTTVTDAGGASAAPRPDPGALSEAARAALAPFARSFRAPPPRTIFTWTTTDQIEALARGMLLTREVSPLHGPSYFDQVMAERAGRDPLARLLQTKAFARMRFAWSAPWATVLGAPNETYGDQLVGVTLKPHAWVAVFATAGYKSPGEAGTKEPGVVVDLEGKLVPVAEVSKHPERLAAVSFVHDADAYVSAPRSESSGSYGSRTPERTKAPARLAQRLSYREYVLCNESMVERFSVGTDTERAAIDASIRAIEAFAAFAAAPSPPPSEARDQTLRGPSSWNRHVSTVAWRRGNAGAARDPYELYEEAVAMPNEYYLPDAANLQALLTRLKNLPAPTARITVAPQRPFVAVDARTPRPPPPPAPKPTATPRGTF